MSKPDKQPFGRFREIFLPIHNYEFQKFLPMMLILFCMAISYTMLRGLKDTVITSEPSLQATAIPSLKFFFVLPSSALFFLIYSSLSNALSREKLYSYTLIFFVSFFVLFGTVLFPIRHLIHVNPETVVAWQASLHPFFAPFVGVFANWSFSLFYIFTELWGTVGIVILFWQFANQITPTSEARRFYPIFGLGSQAATTLAGFLMGILGKISHENFQQEVFIEAMLVLFFGAVALVTYWWMNSKVLTDPRFYDEASLLKKGKEKKPKLSLGDSVKSIITSPYLGYIAIIVIAYNVSINLVEVTWKGTIAERFKGNSVDIHHFYSYVYSAVGIMGFISVLVSQQLMRIFGWYVTAIITPIMLFVGSVLFYSTLVFTGAAEAVAALFDTTPIVLATWIGLGHNVMSKASKYSLLDPSKEMAYIPLDEDMKVKGKSAVDVVGGRLGKAGGSVIQIIIRSVLSLFNAASAQIPAFFGVVAVVGILWTRAVTKLSVEYNAKVKEQESQGKN